MKILLISWFFSPTIGGIPSLLDTLLKCWQKKDMFFYVLTRGEVIGYPRCKKVDSLVYATLRNITQTYEPIPYKTWHELDRVIDIQIKLLAEQISDLAIDVIFAHTDIIIADRLSKITGIPCLAVQHGLMPEKAILQQLGHKVVDHYDWIKDATTEVDAEVSFVSGYNQNQWHKLGMKPKKEWIIYNPINFDLFSYDPEKRQQLRAKFNIPENALVLLYAQRVGKIWFNEGIQVVLKLLQRNPSVYLIICDNYNTETLDPIIQNRVISHMFPYTDMVSVYNASDLTLLIAHDTFGLPIIESLSCGTPVLCNDFCSFNELLFLEQWKGGTERAFFYKDHEDLNKKLQSFINSEKSERNQELLSKKEKKLFSSYRIADQYYDILKTKSNVRSITRHAAAKEEKKSENQCDYAGS